MSQVVKEELDAEQIAALLKTHPKGAPAVRYAATPKRGSEYTPEHYGVVVGANKDGVLIEWTHDVNHREVRKAFVTSNYPGIDRFELQYDHGDLTSLTSIG